ncbi:LEA type 2 family protein [Thioalkalivibrio sp. XN8]|uniref:LEA type 2 family protein n=1 Tax=Thioalkalivibrio sp. XN8 TaxID=2712863 RepID=UPI0013EC03AA|nr:LEA type 2 family protein [Thioalkalivibrio sp. XN8]NGP53302.1 LEA type 2 family protein [Thioalkalivibrio sp. XN8]
MYRSSAILAVLALCLAAAGCTTLSALESPELKVTSFRVLEQEPGSLEQRFAVGLRVINPNNRDIQVDGLDFSLDLNGRRLARGVSNDSFNLPRLGEAETTVVVSTSLVDVLRQAVQLGQRSEEEFEYRLRGKLHLGGMFLRSIPFDHSGRLEP